MKIGILKEGKIPVDRRTPIVPEDANKIEGLFPDIKVIVQKSPLRCYNDEEYHDEGVELSDNIKDCDIFLGVKEVQRYDLFEGKTYLFFSHTTKQQPYNRNLLRDILQKNIRLIDYEMLTDRKGIRLVAFGRYAGIIGTYNGIWAYGKRYKLFNLRRAYTCRNLEDLRTEFKKVELPPIKIALTGSGKAAKGAMEVLSGIGVRKISPAEFLQEEFPEPVFTQLLSSDYNRRIDGNEYDRMDFHEHPEKYEGTFLQYARKADILIAAAFWNLNAPILFSTKDMLNPKFQIKVIADISCDIEGSIPSTKRASTILDPVYDYNPTNHQEEKPFSSEKNVTMMAVDNLPCELPIDASIDFSHQIVANVLPGLLGKDEDEIIKRATITENGHLTKDFEYLENYVQEEFLPQ